KKSCGWHNPASRSFPHPIAALLCRDRWSPQGRRIQPVVSLERGSGAALKPGNQGFSRNFIPALPDAHILPRGCKRKDGSMDATANLKLPFIMPSQAQKHVTHNEGLLLLDAIVQLAVLDRDLTEAPEAPLEGDRYIVAAPAVGAWEGK